MSCSCAYSRIYFVSFWLPYLCPCERGLEQEAELVFEPLNELLPTDLRRWAKQLVYNFAFVLVDSALPVHLLAYLLPALLLVAANHERRTDRAEELERRDELKVVPRDDLAHVLHGLPEHFRFQSLGAVAVHDSEKHQLSHRERVLYVRVCELLLPDNRVYWRELAREEARLVDE